ncbi:MAG: SOS response-associated peptidase [Betaproteobacteria bacterium]|nr:MAG: SOS response-associated peptidase [Betaproteobacteria bacterium]
MCGRYTLSSTPAQINVRFEVTVDPAWKPSYNVAPGTQVLMVRTDAESGERTSESAYWGFTPAWLRPDRRAPRPINARSEGVASKPMFRNAFARRRCIVPADGFYEWKMLDHGKQPWLIRLRDGDVFGFAAIYEPGNETTDNRPSCAILTTEANSTMRRIHARMPVIIEPVDYQRWLQTEQTKAAAIESLLRPYRPDDLVAHPVSARVNSVRNNDADLLRPVAGA